MPKLHPISGKRMIKILHILGFELMRIKGSHHFFLNHQSKKTATVPLHANEVLGIGLLKSILRDMDLNAKEYEKLRSKV